MKRIKQEKFGLLAVLAIAAMTLSACGLAAPPEPTVDPNMIFTQVAETVMVSMTQTAEAMPPTPTPEPTATPEPTLPPIPTQDPNAIPPSPMPTIPIGPTPTVQIFGDGAKWNTQSPMDGKVFKVGQEFTFHVCLGNIGTTDWNTKYNLHFMDGNRLWTNTARFYVGNLVKPGGKWCFDLPSVAPHSTGNYVTYWFLKNADDVKVPGGEVYFAYKVQN